MGEKTAYLEMIKQAQLGDRDNTSRLAEEVRGKVFVYIYRITLDYHLAQDLSQETIIDMLKSLKRLKILNTDSFFAWLYRTALGKIQHHFRRRGRKRIEQKTIIDGGELLKLVPQDYRSGLNAILQKELSQVILKAMGGMKFAYRNVLTLRCFDQMPYSQIASITGGTEMQARLLFFRAKQSLKKELIQNGFKKELLLPAIGLFGTITTSFTKPTLAATTVTSATAKVGLPAAIIGGVTSKAGIVTVATAVIAASITIGTVRTIKNGNAGPSRNLGDIIRTGAFEKPTYLIRSYDPGGNGWKAANYRRQRQQTTSVAPEDILVSPRQTSDLVVIIPKDYWLEFGFPGEIIDGPGMDICFDGRVSGKPPFIFITDGAGQEIQVKTITGHQDFGNGYRMTGFDISDLSLPFKPLAVRFVGADNSGPWGGTELYAVWARVSR